MAIQTIPVPQWEALATAAKAVQALIDETRQHQQQAAALQRAQQETIARLIDARSDFLAASSDAQASLTPDTASGEVQRLQDAHAQLSEAIRALLVNLQHAAGHPSLNAQLVNLDIPAGYVSTALEQITARIQEKD